VDPDSLWGRGDKHITELLRGLMVKSPSFLEYVGGLCHHYSSLIDTSVVPLATSTGTAAGSSTPGIIQWLNFMQEKRITGVEDWEKIGAFELYKGSHSKERVVGLALCSRPIWKRN